MNRSVLAKLTRVLTLLLIIPGDESRHPISLFLVSFRHRNPPPAKSFKKYVVFCLKKKKNKSPWVITRRDVSSECALSLTSFVIPLKMVMPDGERARGNRRRKEGRVCEDDLSATSAVTRQVFSVCWFTSTNRLYPISIVVLLLGVLVVVSSRMRADGERRGERSPDVSSQHPLRFFRRTLD